MKFKEMFLKLDKKSLGLFGVLMIVIPFSPEPHLYQKYKMLLDGKLTRVIDIFDILWHLLPITLFFLRVKIEKDGNKN